jgi:hypothetical protein
MVSFFRKIRQKLLAENKISNYFKYAIGEILLVVIGILIALQINTWNEERKNTKTEQKILLQLKNEFFINLEQLEEKDQLRMKAIHGAQNILNRIDKRDSTQLDKLYLDLFSLFIDPTFDPIKNNIIESDNLRIIKNDSLVRILSNWTSDVFQVQEQELAYQKYREDVIIPAAIRLGLARNIVYYVWKDGYSPLEALNKEKPYEYNSGLTTKTVNLERLFDDLAIEGEVATVINWHLGTNIQSEALKERMELILKLIDQELKPIK